MIAFGSEEALAIAKQPEFVEICSVCGEPMLNKRIRKTTGDLVLDPFGGLMTVPYTAVKMGRKGYGIELNSDYWAWGVRYLEEAELKATTPTLFDLMNMNDMAQAAVMAHD